MNKWLLIIAVLLLVGCTQTTSDDKSVEKCLNMTIEQALIIAQSSECATIGELTNDYLCNKVTGTIWVDITIEDMEGCNPACIVNAETGLVEINYRCTGLITPKVDEVCNMTEVFNSANNSYKVISIGTQCWMAENLNLGLMIDQSENPNPNNNVVEKWCYNNNESFCETDGALYSWTEAMSINETQGICPFGWHPPTDDEWKTLELYLGMTQEQVDDIQELLHRGTDQGTQLKINGSSGFNSELIGFRSDNTRFYGHGDLTVNDQTYYWTSSEANDNAWVKCLSK